MKLRKYAIWALILGIVLLLTGITPIVSLMTYTSQHGSIGIIGGADGPTAIFLTGRLLYDWPVIFILLGLSFIILATVCLLCISKRAKKGG